MSDLESESVLVISCGKETSEQVIFRIIGLESTPAENVEENTNLKKIPWSFENKYYSAEINLIAMNSQEKLEAAFCDTIKAVVIYFDAQKESSFDEISSWMPFIKDVNAEVQLLVCNNSCGDTSSDVVRHKGWEWCIKNQYELVELNQSPDSEDEETADCAKGYDRVIEALQSHPWANLVVKDSNQETDRGSTKNENTESAEAAAESCKHVVVEGEDLPLEEKLLNNVLSGEDPEGESLETLFGKFASMKEKASGLNGEARKKYAEEVAIAFWRAMGGDEDEIGNLDDLDD